MLKISNTFFIFFQNVMFVNVLAQAL